MDGAHHGGGSKSERHHVAQEHAQAVARETAHEEEPHAEPHYVERRVSLHHARDALTPKHHHNAYLHHAQRERTPEECARAALRDNHVGEQRGDGHRGARHAQYLYQRSRGKPFLADGKHDELLSHQSEAQQQREGDERREAHHLAEHVGLATRLVAQAHEHRLRHLRHHALHQRVALRVPLIRLVVVARIARREVVAQQDVEHVVVHVRHYRRGEYLAREAEHAAHRGERDAAQRGAPRRVVPLEEGVDRHVHQSLRGERPVGCARKRHAHTHEARRDDSDGAGGCLLLRLQMLEEVSRLRRAQRGDDDAQEGVAAERHHALRVIVVADERCGEEECGVERGSHDDVEPEHRVVVLRSRILKVGERRAEAAVLQRRRHEREDAYHRHHAVVGWREQSSEHDAEREAHHLLHATIQAAPEQALRCLFLQCFHIVFSFLLQSYTYTATFSEFSCIIFVGAARFSS